MKEFRREVVKRANELPYIGIDTKQMTDIDGILKLVREIVHIVVLVNINRRMEEIINSFPSIFDLLIINLDDRVLRGGSHAHAVAAEKLLPGCDGGGSHGKVCSRGCGRESDGTGGSVDTHTLNSAHACDMD
jgi:hypothetical protein